jgi:G3E family GTPase
VAELEARLRAINARAPIAHAHFGETDISEVLDIRGFNLNAILEIEPDFLEDVSHEHDAGITSFVYRTDNAFDAARIIAFMDVMMRDYGNDLLRYKGIVHIAGCERKIIYQGVHMLLADSFGNPWEVNEIRRSVFVFIGRNLPKQAIHEALDSCRVI